MIQVAQNQIQIFSSRLKSCPCQAKSEIRTAGPRAGVPGVRFLSPQLVAFLGSDSEQAGQPYSQPDSLSLAPVGATTCEFSHHLIYDHLIINTFWLFNIAMENGP